MQIKKNKLEIICRGGQLVGNALFQVEWINYVELAILCRLHGKSCHHREWQFEIFRWPFYPGLSALILHASDCIAANQLVILLSLVISPQRVFANQKYFCSIWRTNDCLFGVQPWPRQWQSNAPNKAHLYFQFGSMNGQCKLTVPTVWRIHQNILIASYCHFFLADIFVLMNKKSKFFFSKFILQLLFKKIPLNFLIFIEKITSKSPHTEYFYI